MKLRYCALTTLVHPEATARPRGTHHRRWLHSNTGGIKRASLVKSINAGDKKKAAQEFLNWNKPKAIVGRRKQKLLAQGAYSNGSKVTVYPADAQGKVQWKKGKTIDPAKD